jgi:hypothetical protein
MKKILSITILTVTLAPITMFAAATPMTATLQLSKLNSTFDAGYAYSARIYALNFDRSSGNCINGGINQMLGTAYFCIPSSSSTPPTSTSITYNYNPSNYTTPPQILVNFTSTPVSHCGSSAIQWAEGPGGSASMKMSKAMDTVSPSSYNYIQTTSLPITSGGTINLDTNSTTYSSGWFNTVCEAN